MTGLLGELASIRRRTDLPQADPSLDRLLEEYQSAPDRGRLGDLLSGSSVANDRRLPVLAVAETVRSDSSGALLAEVADALVNESESAADKILDLGTDDYSKRVRRLRQVLAREPRNAVRWVDLGRDYLILGLPNQARRALTVALSLQPDDRFVLRSACAFYAKVGEYDRALHLLEKSPAVDGDPWLLAPAIAVADLGGLKATARRRSFDVLSDDFPKNTVAELAAALGTIEVRAGSDRRGRQLLRKSLVHTTENALAQVEWISTRSLEIEAALRGNRAGVPRAFEAKAHRAGHEGRFDDAVKHAEQWLLDQPFSIPAAASATFYACEIEDWSRAETLALRGLAANPDDPGLLNNLAFAQASAGKVREGVQTLLRAREQRVTGERRYILAATEGLVLFRMGFVDEGRARYRRVIQAFARGHRNDQAAKASLMLLREEHLAGTDNVEAARREADERAQRATREDVRHLRRRLSEALELPPHVPPHSANSQPRVGKRMLLLLHEAPPLFEGEDLDP